MGLIKRKTSTVLKTSTGRVGSLPDGDLYLFLESSLMNAQQRLAEFRTTNPEARRVVLSMLEEQVAYATLACQEMIQRRD